MGAGHGGFAICQGAALFAIDRECAGLWHTAILVDPHSRLQGRGTDDGLLLLREVYPAGGRQFPHVAQYYNITVQGCLYFPVVGGPYEGQVLVFVDQVAIGWWSNTGYSQTLKLHDAVCASPQILTYGPVPILSGNHLIELLLYTSPAGIQPGGNAEYITGISVAATTGTVSPEPAGSVDSYQQPTSVRSIWKTSISSGATWSALGDTDTQTITGATGVINSGQWSVPYYEGMVSDPVQIWGRSNDYFAPNDGKLQHSYARGHGRGAAGFRWRSSDRHNGWHQQALALYRRSRLHREHRNKCRDHLRTIASDR